MFLCYLYENIFKVSDFNILHLSWLLSEVEKETKTQMLRYELKKGYQYSSVFEFTCLVSLCTAVPVPGECWHNTTQQCERASYDDDL